MLGEVKSSFPEDKKENNNDLSQSIYSIISEEIPENINNEKQNNF